MAVDDRVYAYVAERGLPKDVVDVYGLDAIDSGVVIPIHNPWGDPVGCLVRRFCGEPKYVVKKGTKSRVYPYGLHVSKRLAYASDKILVVEGPFDAMSAYPVGIPVVAALSSSLSKSQAYWISRYTGSAVIAFDRGDTEVENARKSADLLIRAGVSASIARLPDGINDLGEAWVKLADPAKELKEWWADVEAQDR